MHFHSLPLCLVLLVTSSVASASLLSRMHNAASRHTKSLARDLRTVFKPILVSRQSEQARLTYCKLTSNGLTSSGGDSDDNDGGSGSGGGGSGTNPSGTSTRTESSPAPTGSTVASPWNLVETHVRGVL